MYVFSIQRKHAHRLSNTAFSTNFHFFPTFYRCPRSNPHFTLLLPQQPARQDTAGIPPEQPAATAAAAAAAVMVADDAPIDSVSTAAGLEEEEEGVAEEDGPQSPPLEVGDDDVPFATATAATDAGSTSTATVDRETGINARSAGAQAVVRDEDDEATTTAVSLEESPLSPSDAGEMLPVGPEEELEADDAPAVDGDRTAAAAATQAVGTPVDSLLEEEEEEDTHTAASAAPAAPAPDVVPDEPASSPVAMGEIFEGGGAGGTVAEVAGETGIDGAVEVSQSPVVSGFRTRNAGMRVCRVVA